MPQSTNDAASAIYRIAEILNVPFHWFTSTLVARLFTILTPGVFGNLSNTTFEVLFRLILVCVSLLLICPVLLFSLLGVVFNAIGDKLLGSTPYLCFRGAYKGPMLTQFANWNMAILAQPGAFVDGVDASNDRIGKIAALIKNYQFVCGQEVSGAAARRISQLLGEEYIEFYSYVGKSNFPWAQSGLFFASKEKVLSVKFYSYLGAKQPIFIQRGLIVFELEKYYVATTHLDPTPIPIGSRLQKMEQAIAIFTSLTKPIIWAGDFNEERYNNPSPTNQLLSTHFVDCIAEQTPGQTIITRTDILVRTRFGKDLGQVTEESIDFIGVNKNQNQLLLSYLGSEFHSDLSDHYLLKAQINFL